jgi:succinate dehydrogenase hydrophobic anchor subunit
MLLKDPLFLFATAVCLVVLVILLIGIGAFGKGGEFNRKYANKLMQLRILAQGLAVVAIVIFAWARSKGAP